MASDRQKHDGDAIKAHIRKNPDITVGQFLEEIKWKTVPNSVFRYYRDLVRKEMDLPTNTTGRSYERTKSTKRPYRRSIQKVYTTLWSKSTAELGPDGSKAIKELVAVLNTEKVVKWEVVEMADPAVLEIRELAQ